jgi:hypothetical protein
VSDRFTRDPRQPPQRQDDGQLALRVREEMRAAVSNVRAGPSADALAFDDVPDGADRSAEHDPGDRDAERFRHVDPHRLH